MTETEDRIYEGNEKLHLHTAFKFTVNAPKTTDSKMFKTFKIDKTSANVLNKKMHSKKQFKEKQQNYRPMKHLASICE